MKTIPELIKIKRKKHHLQTQELAKQVGVSPTYITHIEHGRRLPSPSVMKRITETLKNPELYIIYLKAKQIGGETCSIT